jgi:hypothetical protein
MGLAFRQNQLCIMGLEKSVVGHYSGGARARNVKEGIARAKEFHKYHLSKGWAGIGYHFVIADDGAIVGCRPTSYVGAHVLNQNSGRIGVNMPGTTGDRPTKRQARAFWWLLHNAHTAAMPQAHRTDRDLSRLPVYGHKDLMATDCPGLFYGMYKKGGEPWISKGPEPEGFCELTPDDFELRDAFAAGREIDPAADLATEGPDEEEMSGELAVAMWLPDADAEFDEDLEALLIEEPQPVG